MFCLQVLSDSQKRAVYDQYGEEGLKGQVPPPGAGGPSGSSYYGGDASTFRFNLAAQMTFLLSSLDSQAHSQEWVAWVAWVEVLTGA